MPFLQLCWENTHNHRYYQVKVMQDMLGDVVLIKTWGTRYTRLGGRQQQVCTSYEEAVQRVDKLHQQRLKHGYRLVQSSGTTYHPSLPL